MPDSTTTLTSKLDPLRSLVERTATGEVSRSDLFSACLKSSFVRTFEFADLVSKADSDIAFFLVPALRGITEDIIYFAFLDGIQHETRELVIANTMGLEVHQRITDQVRFFQTFRPFQPALSAEITGIEQVKANLRAFWQQNGWSNLRRDSPPTREIAGRTVPGILEQVYDFIFRLTSSAVHFNPEILMRLGWGLIPESGDLVRDNRFTTKHMGPYHLSLCQVYGCYLLCLYFELFDSRLKPNPEEKEAVAELRSHIWGTFRWPEMVTFEEMNQPVPDPETAKWPNFFVYALYSVIMNQGFISGAEQILEFETMRRSEYDPPGLPTDDLDTPAAG